MWHASIFSHDTVAINMFVYYFFMVFSHCHPFWFCFISLVIFILCGNLAIITFTFCSGLFKTMLPYVVFSNYDCLPILFFVHDCLRPRYFMCEFGHFYFFFFLSVVA